MKKFRNPNWMPLTHRTLNPMIYISTRLYAALCVRYLSAAWIAFSFFFWNTHWFNVVLYISRPSMHTPSYVKFWRKWHKGVVENYQRKSGNFFEERTFNLLLKKGINFFIFYNSRSFNLLHIEMPIFLIFYCSRTLFNFLFEKNMIGPKTLFGTNIVCYSILDLFWLQHTDL
jgi:hypothetical protein